MQAAIEFAILLLWGGLGGILAGLLGIGGGIIYVLIFSYYLERNGVPSNLIVSSIIANSMFAILFAGASGSYKQWKNKNFFPYQIIITGIAASLASIFFSFLIQHGSWYTKEKFSSFFIILLILIAARLFMNRKKEESVTDEKKKPLYFTLTGIFSGTIAAFSGIGGGVIIVPILTDIMKMPIKKATSISLGVITLMALSTSIYNYFASPGGSNEAVLELQLAVPVAIGSLVASPFGVTLAGKVKPQTIRIILMVFLLLVILKMLFL